MLGLDKTGVDKLLFQLEEKQFVGSRYLFVKENDELKLLGTGGFSYVYEMYDALAIENHYAAKVIGLGTKTVDEKIILDTTQIQEFLSEQSENIMRVIAMWSMKLQLDDAGNVAKIINANQEGYEEIDGIPLEIVLMEKLENILAKDKYGNVELLREELQTEEGVLRFAKDIGRALFVVHNNGYLHRDIKLENIFWDESLGHYKLGDFGIAKYVGEEGAETVVFTDGYGAPEIERQLEASYNVTADVYSFGITLYLLLNDLRFPASDGYHANIIQYSKDFIVPAPANASESMARIIRKMCSYLAKDRYQSVEEVLMEFGRMDGSYTEYGFAEYGNDATETYRDEDDRTETYQDAVVSEDEAENLAEIPWWEKSEEELSREERKKKKKVESELYRSSSVCRMALTALFTFLLLKAISPDASYQSRWQFWILPIAVLVEAILLRVKEFHIEFGFITIGIACFSMYYVGIDVPQIVAILAVLTGIPAIAAGVSIGMGLWIAQMLTEKLSWLDICSEWDLGWIFLILLVAVLTSCVLLRADFDRANRYETFVFSCIMNHVWYVMIIAGIILLVLAHFQVIEIPQVVTRLHLVRSGIGLFVVKTVYAWYY